MILIADISKVISTSSDHLSWGRANTDGCISRDCDVGGLNAILSRSILLLYPFIIGCVPLSWYGSGDMI